MAWLTWRQNRPQLLATAGLVLLLAIAVLVTSAPIRAAYHRQALSSACLRPRAPGARSSSATSAASSPPASR